MFFDEIDWVLFSVHIVNSVNGEIQMYKKKLVNTKYF